MPRHPATNVTGAMLLLGQAEDRIYADLDRSEEYRDSLKERYERAIVTHEQNQALAKRNFRRIRERQGELNNVFGSKRGMDREELKELCRPIALEELEVSDTELRETRRKSSEGVEASSGEEEERAEPVQKPVRAKKKGKQRRNKPASQQQQRARQLAQQMADQPEERAAKAAGIFNLPYTRQPSQETRRGVLSVSDNSHARGSDVDEYMSGAREDLSNFDAISGRRRYPSLSTHSHVTVHPVAPNEPPYQREPSSRRTSPGLITADAGHEAQAIKSVASSSSGLFVSDRNHQRLSARRVSSLSQRSEDQMHLESMYDFASAGQIPGQQRDSIVIEDELPDGDELFAVEETIAHAQEPLGGIPVPDASDMVPDDESDDFVVISDDDMQDLFGGDTGNSATANQAHDAKPTELEELNDDNDGPGWSFAALDNLPPEPETQLQAQEAPEIKVEDGEDAFQVQQMEQSAEYAAHGYDYSEPPADGDDAFFQVHFDQRQTLINNPGRTEQFEAQPTPEIKEEERSEAAEVSNDVSRAGDDEATVSHSNSIVASTTSQQQHPTRRLSVMSNSTEGLFVRQTATPERREKRQARHDEKRRAEFEEANATAKTNRRRADAKKRAAPGGKKITRAVQKKGDAAPEGPITEEPSDSKQKESDAVPEKMTVNNVSPVMVYKRKDYPAFRSPPHAKTRQQKKKAGKRARSADDDGEEEESPQPKKRRGTQKKKKKQDSEDEDEDEDRKSRRSTSTADFSDLIGKKVLSGIGKYEPQGPARMYENGFLR